MRTESDQRAPPIREARRLEPQLPNPAGSREPGGEAPRGVGVLQHGARSPGDRRGGRQSGEPAGGGEGGRRSRRRSTQAAADPRCLARRGRVLDHAGDARGLTDGTWRPILERVAELIERLRLAPHPEGGYYREIWRGGLGVEPLDGRGRRAALTS